MYIEVAKAGLDLWENRSRVASMTRKIIRWIRKGTLRIAIFGPGGMGKTTLGRFLSGTLDPLKADTEYNESIGVEEFKLKGDIPCMLTVPPGQERRRAHTWKGLLADLVKGKAHGVINVVSYGQQSFSLPWKMHRSYTAGMTLKQFALAQAEEARNEELAVVQSLAQHLMLTPKLWMITLVAKQDLWWNERQKVRSYYENGPYNDAIQAISAQVGAANFRHEILSASLARCNRVDSDGTILQKVVAGYDDGVQTANLRQLLDTIVKLGG